ncbi:hypothetical protein ACFWGC_13110 [Cytobacillus pseudoceanisediminis]|uniref:hypothetical protein n=1 Tax=Cytobacillus pseudoceanisediminis TaxID=3051614 RepID=UPI00365554A2
MDNVRQARTRRLVQFGILANKINGYRYGVPKSVISTLIDYRLKLAAMQDDEELRDIAANLTEVTELLIDYAKTLNSGEKEKASELMSEAIAKWDANDKVIERMMSDVV